MAKRQTPDAHGRQRITIEADVHPRSTLKVYRGEATRASVYRRVSAAAKNLGYAAPPPRVAPPGELVSIASADATQGDVDAMAARLVESPPPSLAVVWKAAMTPADARLPWARSIVKCAQAGEQWAVALVANAVTP